ncbi:Aste57867_750 [Aphanomyces stellatus]|uniref:Aste57867_750 protein n=1 Tax=Aphanomyces stellatus TaxID=120398 RepID=A0A485K4K5_9STRA|nr:hypothetical protein As57867_000749 [Aphanomyces stellatus]VFT77974.1 Aste57867_750 [Aphanomyces stellatus]
MSARGLSQTTLAIGVAVVAVTLVALVKIVMDASSSSSSSPSTSATTDDGVVSKKDKLHGYLTSVAKSVEEWMAHMPELTQRVMEEAKARGEFIPEEQLHAALAERMQEAFQAAEENASATFDMSNEAVQEAVQELHEDPDILVAMQRLQAALGQTPLVADVPDDLTPRRTLDAMGKILQVVVRAMEEALAAARARGMKNPNADMHLWQDQYMQKTVAYTAAIYQELGVTEAILNAAVAKYGQEDMAFQGQLQGMLMQQQEHFKRLGL